MEIANPMYDAVFKHLMDDRKSARLLLSALIGFDIVSLIPLPQELAVDAEGRPFRLGHPLSVYRLDYAARIKDQHGAEHVVIVEIQREKVHHQDMRFRKYLGKQYLNSDFYTFVQSASGASRTSGIPILPIYFLGEPPEGFEEVPILLIDRVPVDWYTRTPLNGTNSFLKSLFHQGIIVNTCTLRQSGDSELETLLSIFNPRNQTENPHIMRINETLFPPKYRGILQRLHAIIQDKKVRDTMQVEDEFLAEMQFYADVHAQQLAQAERQKERAERQKEEALRNQDNAIRLLLEVGLPKADIARKLGLSEEDMERY